MLQLRIGRELGIITLGVAKPPLFAINPTTSENGPTVASAAGTPGARSRPPRAPRGVPGVHRSSGGRTGVRPGPRSAELLTELFVLRVYAHEMCDYVLP